LYKSNKVRPLFRQKVSLKKKIQWRDATSNNNALYIPVMNFFFSYRVVTWAGIIKSGEKNSNKKRRTTAVATAVKLPKRRLLDGSGGG